MPYATVQEPQPIVPKVRVILMYISKTEKDGDYPGRII